MLPEAKQIASKVKSIKKQLVKIKYDFNADKQKNINDKKFEV